MNALRHTANTTLSLRLLAGGLFALGLALAACDDSTGPKDTPPTISGQPRDTSLTAGGTASFSVTATEATGYRWVRGTSDTLAGETQATLTLTNVALSLDSTTYKCVVTGNGGVTVSNAALLRVFSLTAPPTITEEPRDTSLLVGGTASFSVSAVGAVSYRWVRGISDTLAGETQATLTLTNVTLSLDNTAYKCVVTGNHGVTVSQAAVLRVLSQDTPPVITRHPADLVVMPAELVTFSVEAVGTGLTYKWVRVRGTATDTIPGVNTATITINDALETLEGATYKAVVRNAYGVTVSNSAVLRIDALRARLIDTGSVLFGNTCSQCHGSNARGYAGAIPPLANSNFFMASRRRVIEIALGGYNAPIVVNGLSYQGDMPEWSSQFTNTEIAGILTYLRAVKNDSTVGTCNTSTLDPDGFAICAKTARTPAELLADSVSIREVRAVRDSMFPDGL